VLSGKGWGALGAGALRVQAALLPAATGVGLLFVAPILFRLRSRCFVAGAPRRRAARSGRASRLASRLLDRAPHEWQERRSLRTRRTLWIAFLVIAGGVAGLLFFVLAVIPGRRFAVTPAFWAALGQAEYAVVLLFVFVHACWIFVREKQRRTSELLVLMATPPHEVFHAKLRALFFSWALPFGLCLLGFAVAFAVDGLGAMRPGEDVQVLVAATTLVLSGILYGCLATVAGLLVGVAARGWGDVVRIPLAAWLMLVLAWMTLVSFVVFPPAALVPGGILTYLVAGWGVRHVTGRVALRLALSLLIVGAISAAVGALAGLILTNAVIDSPRLPGFTLSLWYALGAVVVFAVARNWLLYAIRMYEPFLLNTLEAPPRHAPLTRPGKKPGPA
jgi:ABC-type transport system involved in multi-copper enzyme maturation permease subunit